MPGRSVASVLLLALLHGHLLWRQIPVARAEIDGGGDDEGDIKEGSSIHFDVTPPVVPNGAEARREHFRALHAKDVFRQRRIVEMRNGSGGGGGGGRHLLGSSKIPELMSDPTMFAELPMRSALNIAHVGMYLVVVRFGTPALPFNLVLDTANELTWVSCRLRRRKGKHYGRSSPAAAGQTMSVGEGGAPVKQEKKNWYRPALSSSWRRFRCSQPLCFTFPYVTCPDVSNNVSCSYYQKMQDGTVTIGIYGMEKATVALSDGKMAKLPGLVLGCSIQEAGGSVDAHDGVLALGNGVVSFGVNAATRFGSRFSFCLVSTNSGRDASSYLTFGPNPAVMGPGAMETLIVYNKDFPVGMGFHVDAITVDGKPLDIPPEVFDDNVKYGGVILDTGTSVTGLVPPAYDAVTAALDRHLAHLPRVTELAGFEFCYKWTFTGDGVDPANNVTVPRFALELQGGAVLEVDAKSVVMPEVDPGVACLAFRKLELGGPNIIGNVMMQEHIWEFDHNSMILKFRKDKCANHHLKGSSAANVHHVAPTPIPAPRFIN